MLTMKINYITVIIFLLLFASCQSRTDSLTLKQEQEISEALARVATDFLASWEPPFYPERALSLFTQTEDFCLIIDGLLIDSYSKWAEGVPNFMADDKYFFSSYTHNIKDIKTVLLGRDAGVVTMIYVWESVTKEGVHRRTNGASTLTCRLEESGWKIIHYHGSHGDDQIIE